MSLTSGGEILATGELPKIPSIPAIHFRVVSKVDSDIISLKKELSSQLDPRKVNILQPLLSTSPIVLYDKTAPMVVLRSSYGKQTSFLMEARLPK